MDINILLKMEESLEIVNRVANSSLISIDLEEWYPTDKRVLFDIKPLLYEELILKEKDFRDFIKNHDWLQYQDTFVAITNTADAIVPTWAYMLLVTKLEPGCKKVVFGNLQTLEEHIWKDIISNIDLSKYEGARLVIKGCSKVEVPIFAYTELTRVLRPIAQSILFGEPCSTVPLYKKTN